MRTAQIIIDAITGIESYFVVGTLGGVGLPGVGFAVAPPDGFGFGGVVGAGVTLMAVICRLPR